MRAARERSTAPPSAGAWLLAAGCALVACEPKLVVGEWTCSENGAVTTPPAKTDPVALPWSTGFENRFCDYSELGGFCLDDPLASVQIVTSPVHSGNFAAAFSVASALSEAGYQARCVRQGALPTAAYYGAWYYVPALATTSTNWNLLHFHGGDPSAQHGLWDISLVNGASGDLELAVFDFLHGLTRQAASPVPIPIGSWFHIQFYLKRAADATGEVALYQDGRQLLDASGLITDDTSWGQWYVGNFAVALTPSDSTVYVDDVSIGTTL
jgi:hypothetical protein